MAKHEIRTVVGDGWNVGTCKSSSDPNYYLQPFRGFYGDWKPRKATVYGMAFSSHEAASAYALDRGYTRQYFGPYGMTKALHRESLLRIQNYLLVGIRKAETWAEAYRVTDLAARTVAEITGNALDACHWGLGYADAARGLRPDLWQAERRRRREEAPELV